VVPLFVKDLGRVLAGPDSKESIIGSFQAIWDIEGIISCLIGQFICIYVNVCINISFIEKGIEFYFEEIFTLSFFGEQGVTRVQGVPDRSDYTWKRGNVRALLRVPYQQQRRFTETPELLSTKL
jgi:hypothetical protein